MLNKKNVNIIILIIIVKIKFVQTFIIDTRCVIIIIHWNLIKIIYLPTLFSTINLSRINNFVLVQQAVISTYTLFL